MKPKFLFKFERRQVENQEMDVLLEAFDPQRIATPSLRQCFGAIQIGFDGYAGCPDHPVLIPEVRCFLRALARRWGPRSAPFFCEARTPFLVLYFTAQLDHLMVVERDDQDGIVLFHRRNEAVALRRLALSGVRQLGQQAGFTPATIQRRQRKLSKLFKTALCFEIQP